MKSSKQRQVQPCVFQQPTDDHSDRKDHVWTQAGYELKGTSVKDGWKCCLCGAVTVSTPPAFPTPGNWMPDGYMPLTEEERRLSPSEHQPL